MSEVSQETEGISTDRMLVDAILSGNQRAFQTLVERYQGMVATIVIGMLGDASEAEDVAQETMIRVYHSLASYQGDASLKTWITRIAMNLAVDTLRKRKKWLEWFRNSESEPLEEMTNGHQGDVQWEKQQAIRASFRQLKPQYRSVAMLRLVLGYSTDDTAEILKLPQGTVLSRLARARKQLAEDLRDFMYDE
ncbi:RNA polymerase sigma factor [Endozoicomonas arenosclerae]|uniref:RNA polymerase sigma factor n=1 Tax=Endozoicomonas arenosclerae TaxID=1633495 RepID=UPI000783B3D8|nr:sigma-70 family RNA polymerase sigma factor [Endozoicomonas arenosclerae]